MKILNRKQFLKLPSGVLYSLFKYCIMDGLFVKFDSIGDVDWVLQDLIDTPKTFTPSRSDDYEIYKKSHEEGNSFDLDYEASTRDGLYEEDQLFAVYEKEDVEKLIQTLKEIKKEYPSL